MVEWRKIGDICEIIRGNGVQKTDFVEDGVGCIHYGQIYTHYGPFTYSTNKFVSKETFEKARKASKGDIVMTDTSENVEDICKSVAYLGEDDIAVSNHALILKHNQNPKFLSYSTLTNSFLDQKRKFVVGVKVSGIKPEQLAKIKIYLPSLSEQNRIVGILDTFTSSIENLKEQITQRRKQYEYYRDQLLDLEGKEGTEMKIADFCLLKAGKSISSEDITENESDNSYPCIGGNGKRGYVSYFSHEGAYPIIGRQGALCGCVNWITGKFYATEHAVVAKGSAFMDQRFLFYLFENANLNQYKTQGAQPGLSVAKLNEVRFIIPPLAEQQRIVDILDKFETSIQNLEAQLSQREKQYEYYRNKLLTFE